MNHSLEFKCGDNYVQCPIIQSSLGTGIESSAKSVYFSLRTNVSISRNHHFTKQLLISDLFQFGRNPSHKILPVETSASDRYSTIGIYLQCMERYFAEFGEIAALRYWANSPEIIHGIVSFQREKSAKRSIGGRVGYAFRGNLRLWSLDSNDVIQTKRSVFYFDRRSSSVDALENHDGPNILDLDEDCIQEIFAHLNVPDLCSVAKVCQRFKASAQKRFAVHHKSIHFLEIASLDVDALLNFMETFGAFVEKLKVSPQLLPNNIQFPNLLARHFTTLKALSLSYFHMDDSLVNTLHPLLVRMSKLSMYKCILPSSFCAVLTRCSNLTKLKIVESRLEYSVWQPVSFPKMESLTIIPSQESWQLPAFLKCNPQLKKVCLELDGSSTDDEVITELSRPNSIEEIEMCLPIRISGELNISDLCRLRALKKLELYVIDDLIEGRTRTLLESIAANIFLEHLELSCFVFDRPFADAICGLKTLKVFCLNLMRKAHLDANDLYQVCENLNELTDLHVRRDAGHWDQSVLPKLFQKSKNLQRIRVEGFEVKITAATYEKLLAIVNKRNALRPLQSFICPKSMEKFKKCVPQSTINANLSELVISRLFI